MHVGLPSGVTWSKFVIYLNLCQNCKMGEPIVRLIIINDLWDVKDFLIIIYSFP
jgi:hypothetical protein